MWGAVCIQVEINPLATTPDGRVVCFDAKINFDDNAEFRQKEIFAQEDTSELNQREVAAAALGLNYGMLCRTCVLWGAVYRDPKCSMQFSL